MQVQILFLVACLVASVLCTDPRRLRPHVRVENQFQSWMAKHGKTYVTEEEFGLRLENFKASIKRVEEKNARSTNATFALNKFSDLSPEEFRAMYLMKEPLKPLKEKNLEVARPSAGAQIPQKFDWRSQKVVSTIKDQGQCGSCWAFSVTENIESVYMLANNITAADMKPLAPQQIVDCDTTDDGCNGGYPDSAYDYIVKAGGLETEAKYPYTGVDENCAFKKEDVLVKISGYKAATTEGDETTLRQNLVENSPLSICVDAAYWQDYSSGVLSAWDCCWLCQLDHCVQLVGYDNTAATPYYVVRNSWGPDWGVENGYIYLEMGKNTCGLTDYATFATI